MSRGVIAGADVDAFRTPRAYQSDAAKRTVMLEIGRFVNEAILVAEIGLNDLQIG
jgi:hypothetical protein